MNKHNITTLFLVCILIFALTGCTAEVPLTTADGTTYEVTSVSVADQYAERVPSDGTEFLLVTVQGTDSELDNMQNVFFGSSGRAQVSDGTTTVSCSLIVYAPRGGDKLDVILMFQIPTSFADDFSMYGDSFEPVSLSVER